MSNFPLKDRVVQHPNRVKLIPTGIPNEFDVERAEGQIIQEGNPLNADLLNQFFQSENPQEPLFLKEGNVINNGESLSEKKRGVYVVLYNGQNIPDAPDPDNTAGRLVSFALGGDEHFEGQLFLTTGNRLFYRAGWGLPRWQEIPLGVFLRQGTYGILDGLLIESEFPTLSLSKNLGAYKGRALMQATADISGTSLQVAFQKADGTSENVITFPHESGQVLLGEAFNFDGTTPIKIGTYLITGTNIELAGVLTETNKVTKTFPDGTFAILIRFSSITNTSVTFAYTAFAGAKTISEDDALYARSGAFTRTEIRGEGRITKLSTD